MPRTVDNLYAQSQGGHAMITPQAVTSVLLITATILLIRHRPG
jgi:hypothetical protein